MSEPPPKRVQLHTGNSQYGRGINREAKLSNSQRLKAPFPYMGGKGRIADVVWQHFGEVSNYIEPFCGSAANLLARPCPFGGVETINDVNAYITNFWRAVSRNPEDVVAACDWPVNELDLHSRHRWLVLSPEAIAFRERMRTDPDHFDAKIAGWWVWGACCWIGGEWCRYQDGPGRRPSLSSEGEGVHLSDGSMPNLSGDAGAAGRGVVASAAHKRKKPRTEGDNEGSVGKGVHAAGHRKRPRAHRESGSGAVGWEQAPGVTAGGLGGVHSGLAQGQSRPQLGDAFDVGRGVHASGDLGTCEQRRAWLLDWFGRLQDRLRLVRVCCGHWLRVCDSPSVTTRLGTTAIFLDPPYPIRKQKEEQVSAAIDSVAATPEDAALLKKAVGKAGKSRSAGLYQGDDADALDRLRDEVLAYCVERGPDPLMRLCVAGYDTDGYQVLIDQHGWREVRWQAQGGYANRGENKGNRERERLYFSPHCRFAPGLFDLLDNPEPL